jgi:hypothetical protein
MIKISKDFATLWTTIDPVGNVALLAGLTASLVSLAQIEFYGASALKCLWYVAS